MFSCRQNAFLLSPDSRQERTTRSICSSVCFMITVFHKAKHKLPSCKDVLARVLTDQLHLANIWQELLKFVDRMSWDYIKHMPEPLERVYIIDFASSQERVQHGRSSCPVV